MYTGFSVFLPKFNLGLYEKYDFLIKNKSNEIKLFFPTLEEAIIFAEKKHYSYEVVTPTEQKATKKSYASNFC